MSRYVALTLVALFALPLSACSSSDTESDSDMVSACFEHAQADPENLDAMPGLADAKIKPLETAASKDGDGWVAVGKAEGKRGIIEFGCELDSSAEVISSQVGPEGSLDTN